MNVIENDTENVIERNYIYVFLSSTIVFYKNQLFLS